MRAFVLAGGFGTRMHPITEVTPKCLLPVDGTPCARIIIQRIIHSGVVEPQDVVLCINRWAEKQFTHEFRDLEIKFSVSPKPLGTAGELLYARKFIEEKNIFHYGDDLTKVDYNKLVEWHQKWKADLTLAGTDKIYLNLGLITVEDGLANGRIVEWKEKPFIPTILVWAAVAAFNRESFLPYLGNDVDISHEVIPQMMADGKKVYCYNTHSRWVDIGSLERWQLANKLAKKGEI